MKKIYRVYNVSVEIHALKKHYVSASEIEDMYMSSDNRPCLETENLDEAMNKFQSITVDTRRIRSAVPYYLCDAAAIQEFVIDDDEDEEFGDFYDFHCIPMVDEIDFDFSAVKAGTETGQSIMRFPISTAWRCWIKSASMAATCTQSARPKTKTARMNGMKAWLTSFARRSTRWM